MNAARGFPQTKAPPEEGFGQNFWPWFALGVLVFCWVAEASMCAMRGF